MLSSFRGKALPDLSLDNWRFGANYHRHRKFDKGVVYVLKSKSEQITEVRFTKFMNIRQQMSQRRKQT